MHILKRLFGRLDGPLLHAMVAGSVIMVISSLGLFYMWHSAREAQLDAVRTELKQLARVAATLVDGDRHRLIRSPAQATSSTSIPPFWKRTGFTSSWVRTTCIASTATTKRPTRS
jgi:hypothetical protein